MESLKRDIHGKWKFKVLLLEDDQCDTALIVDALTQAEIEAEIRTVQGGYRFENALSTYLPDVILCDHGSNNLTPLDALNFLKTCGREIPFILLTSGSSEDFAMRAILAGADDYILKDRMRRLPIAVTTVVEKFRLAREQKKIELQTRESEAKYRALFENSMDGMLLTITDGRILAANPAACEMLHMTESEICQKGRFGIVDQSDPNIDILIAERQQTGRARGEVLLVRKDGIRVPVELTSNVFVDALGHERNSIVFREITERKKAEERILQSTTALENAISELTKFQDSSLDMICAVDEHGYILRVSAACKTILGYTQVELKGKRIFDLVHPEDVDKTLSSAKQVMSGQNIRNFENRYIRKDGATVHLIWSTRWDPTDRIRYGVARDATDIKKAERMIASERRRLSNLIMNAPVAICILKGKDHVFEFANPVYLLQSGKTDVVGKPVREIFPEFESQQIFDIMDNVYQTGVPFAVNEMEIRIDKDGSGQLHSVYQNMLQQPYQDADGNVEGIFYFGVDVTDQVLSRKRIEVAEQRYRQIVETAQEGIWVIDENDVTTFVNDKMCELLECPKNEMIGKSIYDFMDEESKRKVSVLMKKRKAGSSGAGHFKYITKAGRELWTNISANPLYNELGTYKGSLAMITNITEQKKTEEENRKLAMVASLTVNAVIVTNPQGEITWVNQGFERITEFSLDEVKGKKPGNFLQGPDTDRETVQLMSSALKEEKGFRIEIINCNKSGRHYWLDIEVVPLHDANGLLTGFMAIQQDITERKKSQKEALTLIDNLERRNKNLQQFSYIVSHNLRAPISKILGLVNAVETELPENKLLIDKIADEASHLDDVIKDMSTIVAARQLEKVQRERVSFEAKIKNILQLLEDQIAESGAQVYTDFFHAPEVFTIKSYLHSILYNLISNAIKYRNSAVPLQIYVHTSQDEEFICLTIRDNGSGIDLKKNKDKVFGLYKRFHGSSVPGRGMGLNLVKTHTESLGGKIEVQSEIDRGTTFFIYLPKQYEKDLD